VYLYFILFYLLYLNFSDRSVLETYVRKFHSIQNLDIIQIKSNLDLFTQSYHQSDEIEKLRNLLKKELLVEILKSDHADKEFFSTCLEETNKLIDSVPAIGYPCVLVGCKFVGKRHTSYVMHIKKTHPSLKGVKCNFKSYVNATLLLLMTWCLI
jgi:hypothetical protein